MFTTRTQVSVDHGAGGMPRRGRLTWMLPCACGRIPSPTWVCVGSVKTSLMTATDRGLLRGSTAGLAHVSLDFGQHIQPIVQAVCMNFELVVKLSKVLSHHPSNLR
jgi:hypothetical protein